MQNLPQDPSVKMYVKRLLICETMPQHQQYFRPYHTNCEVDAVNKLQDRIDQSNGAVSAALFSGISTGIMAPTATPTALSNIVHGWGEKRFRFLLEARFPSPLGETTEVILGYTDHPGATNPNMVNTRTALDPNMVFYINSIVKTRTVQHNTMQGSGHQVSVISGNHVLSNHGYSDPSTNLYNLSPENVMNNLVTSTYSVPGQLSVATDVLSSTPISSKRLAASPANYLSMMFNSVSNAARENEMKVSMPSYQDLYQQARMKLGFTSNTEDYFTKALLNIRQSIDPIFTYRDLVTLDPSIEGNRHDCVVINWLKPAMKVYDNPLSTEHMGGSNTETIAANVIAGSLPGLLLDSACTYYHFTATNKTLNGQFVFTLAGIDSFGNMDLTPYIESLNNRITLEVLNDISFNNSVPLELEVRCDVMGETYININFNGQGYVPFVVPSYADALWTPVVTTSRNDIGQISEDMSSMLNMVIDRQSNLVYPGGDAGYIDSSFTSSSGI